MPVGNSRNQGKKVHLVVLERIAGWSRIHWLRWGSLEESWGKGFMI